MASRSGSVHVVTNRRTYKGTVYETHLLRRTFREGGTVKNQTLGNISHLPPDLIDLIKQRLRDGIMPSVGTGFTIQRSYPHGHVAAVLGTLRGTGLDSVIASRSCAERDLVLAMIVQRILSPQSKLATARSLCEQTATTTLRNELGIIIDSERPLYEALDWLAERQERIENKLATKHLHDGSLILYDVSSSYYTGSHCSLVKFGHNRDGKHGFPQIVYGLLCNSDGCPVAIEVFEGNTADPVTVPAQIEKVRRRFHIERVVFVGDRGMITSKRIEENFRGVQGLDWISALRTSDIRSLVDEGIIDMSLLDDRDFMEVQSPDFPDERLVVCLNPLLAEKRAHVREELLVATEKKLDEIVLATKRARNPLRGKDAIGVRVGKIMGVSKVGKHFVTTITETSFAYHRNAEKIGAEANLDGLYVIRTSISKKALGAESTVRAYKDLAKVERAFRSLKTVDLKVRPIYHYLEGRVRAHVFLCMLAYYVEWHMRQKLRSILFDDDDPEGAQALRSSIVAPAQRSNSARSKDRTKRTEEGFPVHSFRTLLADLATLTKNKVRPSGVDSGEFFVLSEPTLVQRRAFDLLGVNP